MKRLILSLLILLFSLEVYAAPTINIIPNQPSYQVGDTVLLSVSLSDAPEIHGGGLNISFNPAVIQAQSVVIDSVWKFANRTGVINNAAGNISDILFSNFNTVSGELGVALIQLTVVGDGDSALSVNESAKNPFSDADGQIVSFDINNMFVFSTQVAETPDEPTPVPETTTTTTTTQTVAEPIAQTSEQPSNQTTSTDLTTTNNNNGNQTFSSNIASVNLPNNVVGDKPGTDNSQVERQILLPSGPGSIPIKIIDDVEMQRQIAGNTGMNNTNDGYDRQSSSGANESLLASAKTVAEEQGSQVISEMQSADMSGNSNVDSPVDYLSFVLILAVLFVGFIVFKVFFNK